MHLRRWGLPGPPLGCCCSLALWLELEVLREEGGWVGREKVKIRRKPKSGQDASGDDDDGRS